MARFRELRRARLGAAQLRRGPGRAAGGAPGGGDLLQEALGAHRGALGAGERREEAHGEPLPAARTAHLPGAEVLLEPGAAAAGGPLKGGLSEAPRGRSPGAAVLQAAGGGHSEALAAAQRGAGGRVVWREGHEALPAAGEELRGAALVCQGGAGAFEA